MADETHDRALICWLDAANDPASDFPIQNLPFGRFRKSRDDAWRIGVAIGDQVLDLERAGLADDRRHERADGAAARSASRIARARCRARCAAAATARPDCAPRLRAVGGRARRPLPHRRLHRLLHEHPSRHRGRAAVPARQSAAAQLQVGADRLSRACLVDRRQRNADPPAAWTGQGRRCRCAALRSDAAPRLRARARRVHRARQRARRRRSRSPTPRTMSSAWRCSTTGPRATSRRGNTSRSGRSCRRTSRRRVSPWMVTLDALAPFRAPFARPAGDPQPLPYLTSPRNRASGAFDIALEVLLQTARMRDAGAPAQRADAVELPRQLLDARAARRASHGQRLQPAAGRSARHRHAVGPGRQDRAARCSSCPPAASSRCASPTARRAASSKTATPSSCAPTASARDSAASASASAPARSCRQNLRRRQARAHSARQHP